MNPAALPRALLAPAFFARAVATRWIKPKRQYFLFSPPQKSLQPISSKWGFDRGKPVDRYYIEAFLRENRDCIRGRCLEIHDSHYTQFFGGNRVSRADVLDIDTGNRAANIYGDLRQLPGVASDIYDCLIITHTFGVIDDYRSAIGECYRILKPGGTLLATVAASGPMLDLGCAFWRFTPAGAKYEVGRYFPLEAVRVQSYGNVLSGQCFWVGLSSDELAPNELDYNDPRFPIVVGVRAQK